MDDSKYIMPTSIRIPPDLKDAVRRRATAEGRKLTQHVVYLLQQYVESTPEPKAKRKL